MDYLILIDALNPVPAEPVQLSEVCGVRLEHQAAEQLKQMLSSAEREGVRIKALSGYRSPEYQQRLWEAEVEKHHLSGLPLPEAERLTARTLARPGHSEHNCGLAVDLCTPDAEDTQDDFFLTPQSRWLCRSAHRGKGLIPRTATSWAGRAAPEPTPSEAAVITTCYSRAITTTLLP